MNDTIGFAPLLGGALIGIAAVLLLKLNGRIAGISGIVNAALSTNPEGRLWRLMFIAGLLLGGLIFQWLSGEPMAIRKDFPLLQLAAAGLLVGFGTRLGSGCTSGHGVCGLARLSKRSLAATVVFISVGMAVASGLWWIGRGL